MTSRAATSHTATPREPTLSQLYYTSCEHGLSDYAGYQFNAVTPGTSQETQREVLSLVAYEPPPSLAYPQDDAQLASCPVNLCHRPASATAPAVLASVEYLGRDFSKRFGNFFAHALAAPQPDLAAALGPLLPIELWRSPLWRRAPVESTEIPALTGRLVGGHVHPGTVEDFLARHRARARLAELVTAVADAACGGKRSVLLVEREADHVAQWIGAVCYLLPPRMAARISFATYTANPAHSRLNVIGTIAEIAAALSADTLDLFTVFDIAGFDNAASDRIGADRPSAAAPHPLAALMVRVGLLAAPALWEDGMRLAAGTETRLDDWYPVGAAAAALGGVPLTRPELSAAVAWLETTATHLDGRTVSELGSALHVQPGLSADLVPALARAALRGDDAALSEELRFAQIDHEMAQAAAGVRGHAQPGRMSAAFRERVTGRLAQLVDDAPIAETLRLIDWADDNGIAVDGARLARFSRQRLAAALTGGRESAADPGPQELRESVVARHPALRRGLVEYLADLYEREPAALDATLFGPLGRLVADEDVAGHPALREALVISTARRHVARRPEALARILALRGRTLPDDALISRLWPEDTWSAADAAAVAQRIPLDELDDPAVALRFIAALRQATSPRDLTWYLPLSQALLAAPVAGRLNDGVLNAARRAVEADRLTSDIRDFNQLSAALHRLPADLSMVRALCEQRLPRAVATLPLTAGQLDAALRGLSDTAVVECLLILGRQSFDRGGRGLSTFAGVFRARSGLRSDARKAADEVLRAWASSLRKRDWEDLARAIAAADKWAGLDFQEFALNYRRGRKQVRLIQREQSVGSRPAEPGVAVRLEEKQPPLPYRPPEIPPERPGRQTGE